jgi:hypothetical protein
MAPFVHQRGERRRRGHSLGVSFEQLGDIVVGDVVISRRRHASDCGWACDEFEEL